MITSSAPVALFRDLFERNEVGQRLAEDLLTIVDPALDREGAPIKPGLISESTSTTGRRTIDAVAASGEPMTPGQPPLLRHDGVRGPVSNTASQTPLPFARDAEW